MYPDRTIVPPNTRLQLTGVALFPQSHRGGQVLSRGFRRPQLKRKPLGDVRIFRWRFEIADDGA